ncbi:protein UPSTREAM OF FLC-like [Cucurbita pepo subsp. pepo]|uniref:protein UPSTREAM OF FLC-like n=1 Tax=Cucurbita pepo subsp. pepo TaxID=3664 RepID=UPI000C9DA4AE|nr:protein UPSTREAM OF FLC-like [Cucurbita pepo subsp. pepo]XP_023513167.1 protein UPSTREAM OF FLC-like [Cucurbita pepo subsp. pepo]XP_023513168.1 protein UPSTREAM OF FLC-like [Cucurbita pepo subsp. pepo]XP_023513169.1 protein UPSTREAM OF FLC-like [Cucurbita pepo subsp. pepo]XP_023513170.1 protein UPSTREAM OF FLC-like [Cucurbita pepo subsp. pepo]
METRMKKYNQLSPERAKVWTEKSPKYQQTRKVPVIYYLCRNRQLEHPHFMEVPLSSPEGLFLRDVINRLNVLRGRGMATLYSWSCKRSYKNGFVWHDLCEDDLILPAHGNEYVLKGSELFEELTSSKDPFSSIGNVSIQPLKQLPDPASSQSQDDSSSSSSMNGKEMKNSQVDDLSLTVLRPGSSGMSPDSGGGKSSWGGCLSLTEYKVYKTDGLSDASTQTEENISRPKTRETCTRGVSTDDGSLDPDNDASNQKKNYNAPPESVSPPPLSSSASSSGEKTETLESLIRADASKVNSFRIVEEEEIRMPTNARLKATNVLMQLISCGSISVKDHSFGLIPSYKPRFSHSKFPSPLFSTTVMLGELNCLSENHRMMGLRLEDKEYFSGSLIETKMLQGDGLTTLKRSSSYNADRTCKQLSSTEDKDGSTSGRSKCIPRAIKASLSKQPRNEPMKSPTSDRPRNSNGVDSSQTTSPTASIDSSKRITEPCSTRKQSKRLDSFREEEEDVIKIEERLASGARVIIWSKSTCNSTDVSST